MVVKPKMQLNQIRRPILPANQAHGKYEVSLKQFCSHSKCGAVRLLQAEQDYSILRIRLFLVESARDVNYCTKILRKM